MPRKSPDEVSGMIIGAALKVHTALGPGLLESTYEVCLEHELKKAGLRVLWQVFLPIIYDGIEIASAYRIDVLVEDCVIVEIKSVESIHEVHRAQLISISN